MTTAESDLPAVKPSGSDGMTGVFRLEAEYWTIAYQGLVLRLRDTKGMRYLGALLQSPGHRFPAAALLPAAGEPAQNPDPEQARIAVTKRIKDAVRRIRQHHPSLGYHLARVIKTGRHCVYLPDPERPVTWLTE